MAYGRRRRRTYRRSSYRTRGYRASRFRRAYSTRYGRPLRRRRRSYARSRRGGGRTIRLVVQTVASSPMSLGMKGLAPTRRLF